jgi:transcriptional regulator with XRE-family HTH domain
MPKKLPVKKAAKREAPFSATAVDADQQSIRTPSTSTISALELWLGERLRLRRKELRRPLQQVADACGISVSLLSQIERGLRSISLRTLNALAKELDVPAETLVMNAQHRPTSEEKSGMVTRSGNHPRIEKSDKGIKKENLTPPHASGTIGLYRAVIAPGGATGPELFTTVAGEQIGYVFEGQLELFIDGQLLMLYVGDSFLYRGETPRKWRNPGPGQTIVVWAISSSK